ncbi:MAG: elongation factor G [bacterium]
MSMVRNAGIISPKGTGKTSLAEAILFDAKVINRLGRVEDGNTAMDFDSEETERKMTLYPSIYTFDYSGSRIHLVDTAGYPDFFSETRFVARTLDNAIFTINAGDGIKSQALKFWRLINELKMPRMLFITGMDKELADFPALWETMQSMLQFAFVPITIPIVKSKKLIGVIDLIKMKYFADKGDKSGEAAESDIPAEYADFAAEYREKMLETVAESNDSLMERYLEGGELKPEEISKALKAGSAGGTLCPVFAGSATANIGVKQFLDQFVGLSAAPDQKGDIIGHDGNEKDAVRKPTAVESFSATVLKTMVDQYAGKLSIFRVLSGTIKPDTNLTISEKNRKARAANIFMITGKAQKQVESAEPGDIACIVKVDEISTGDTICDPMNVFILPSANIPEPVIALAVAPKERGDEDKLSRGLNSLLEEDPLLKTKRDEQTKQLTICGTGQVHLDTVVSRLRKRFQINLDVAPPEIPYRETITKAAKYVEYTHKKQTGGAGQFARVFIDLEPLESGAGYEFADKIFGGVIDQNFRPSVDKGIRARMAEGVLAGYPFVDVRASLVDGKTHPVDSKDIAFQIAGREVFKKAVMMCNPILLEPIMNLEIEVPDECMGDVIGDLNSRRGRVVTTDQASGSTIIKATCPLAELLRYAPDLDSMTSGRGTYSMELSHYEEVPKRVADEIIAKYNKRKTEEQ